MTTPTFVSSPSTQSESNNSMTTNNNRNDGIDSSQNEPSLGVIVGLIVSLFVLVVIGIVVFVVVVVVRKQRKRKKQLKQHNIDKLKNEESDGTVVIESKMNTIISFDETNTNTTTLSTYQPAGTERLKGLSTSEILLRRSQITFSELKIEKELGEGSYGKVCLGKWISAPVALKFCKKKGKMEDFMNEIRLMIELPPHPNVVQMFGVSLDGPQPVIVMEYCDGGSLDKLLFDSNVKLSEEHKIQLIRGIAAGMFHLHKHNIVHRDLAARNILLTSRGDPKISDFGMSRILEKAEEGKTQSGVGPVCWMAPESISQKQYSKKSDVWTFGIVVYEIVVQCEPHKDKDVFDVGVRIRDEGLTPEIPSNCPQKLRELMQMCWKKQPQQRPDFETICAMLEQ